MVRYASGYGNEQDYFNNPPLSRSGWTSSNTNNYRSSNHSMHPVYSDASIYRLTPIHMGLNPYNEERNLATTSTNNYSSQGIDYTTGNIPTTSTNSCQYNNGHSSRYAEAHTPVIYDANHQRIGGITPGSSDYSLQDSETGYRPNCEAISPGTSNNLDEIEENIESGNEGIVTSNEKSSPTNEDELNSIGNEQDEEIESISDKSVENRINTEHEEQNQGNPTSDDDSEIHNIPENPISDSIHLAEWKQFKPRQMRKRQRKEQERKRTRRSSGVSTPGSGKPEKRARKIVTPEAYLKEPEEIEQAQRIALAVQRSYKWIAKNHKTNVSPYSELYYSLGQVISSELPEEIALKEEYKQAPQWHGSTEKWCREGTYWEYNQKFICENCREKHTGRENWKYYCTHQMITRAQASERACCFCSKPILKFHSIAECGSCILAYWEIPPVARGAYTIDVESRFRSHREARRNAH